MEVLLGIVLEIAGYQGITIAELWLEDDRDRTLAWEGEIHAEIGEEIECTVLLVKVVPHRSITEKIFSPNIEVHHIAVLRTQLEVEIEEAEYSIFPTPVGPRSTEGQQPVRGQEVFLRQTRGYDQQRAN